MCLSFLCKFDKHFLIFRAVDFIHFFPSEMLRGCLVGVICNSSSFHSFIFKLCIMIVYTLNMYTLIFAHLVIYFWVFNLEIDKSPTVDYIV